MRLIPRHSLADLVGDSSSSLLSTHQTEENNFVDNEDGLKTLNHDDTALCSTSPMKNSASDNDVLLPFSSCTPNSLTPTIAESKVRHRQNCCHYSRDRPNVDGCGPIMSRQQVKRRKLCVPGTLVTCEDVGRKAANLLSPSTPLLEPCHPDEFQTPQRQSCDCESLPLTFDGRPLQGESDIRRLQSRRRIVSPLGSLRGVSFLNENREDSQGSTHRFESYDEELHSVLNLEVADIIRPQETKSRAVSLDDDRSSLPALSSAPSLTHTKHFCGSLLTMRNSNTSLRNEPSEDILPSCLLLPML